MGKLTKIGKDRWIDLDEIAAIRLERACSFAGWTPTFFITLKSGHCLTIPRDQGDIKYTDGFKRIEEYLGTRH